MNRTSYTTQSAAATERLIERYQELFDTTTEVDAELVHGLYAELAAAEKAQAAGAVKDAGAREWRCEQDRWVGLFAAIGASVVADATPEEQAFLARQKGATITAGDEAEIAELVDWTPEESPEARRARNWAARQAR